MTILEMLQQGRVLDLIGMGIMFVLMGIVMSAIGGGKTAVVKEASLPLAEPKTVNLPAQMGFEVTAAITAAVNEFRKNK